MLGDNVKTLRKIRKMTQQQFAEQIGVRQSTIAMVETNKTTLSRQALMSICREFGVRLEWLETGEGEMWAERDTSILAQLEADKVLTPKGRELMEHFLKLPPELQDLVADAIKAAARMYTAQEQSEEVQTQIEIEEIVPSVTRRKADSELTREERHAMLDAELDAMEAAKKEGVRPSKVFTGLNGRLRKFGKSP